jgi:hypothetical protein
MTVAQFYPIGTPGQPWGDAERAQWRARQQRRRSYHDDVVAALERLDDSFDVIQYGQLDYAPDHTRCSPWSTTTGTRRCRPR